MRRKKFVSASVSRFSTFAFSDIQKQVILLVFVFINKGLFKLSIMTLKLL